MASPNAIQLREIVPEPLRLRDQWVLWKLVKRKDKLTKMPVDPTRGSAAKSTNPSTWSSFGNALLGSRKFGSVAGIGYVFVEDDPFCGVDLDECIVDGKVVPEAQAIIDALNTYTEVSPSGCGVKLFGMAKKPKGTGCKTRKVDGFKEIEIYDRGRFFTVTGQHLAGTPKTIEKCQEEIIGLCRRYWPNKAPSSVSPRVIVGGFNGSDDELIKLAIASKTGDRFERLLRGDLSDYDGDHSRADLAFCNMLAFWTGRDRSRMDVIFRKSGLYRDKWERNDYRGWTLDKAVESCSEVFTPAGTAAVADISALMPGKKKKTVEIPDIGDPDDDAKAVSALLTDVGNAGRLVRREEQRIRYCYGPGQWVIWEKSKSRGHPPT